MEKLINIKSYPKSINGIQCVGPCYKKNTKILHPIYLNVVTNNDKSFCPISKEIGIKNGKKYIEYVDACNDLNLNKNNTLNSKFEMLFPYIDFKPDIFLNLFYNILTFGDSIEWIINNNHLPLDTKERIFNISLDAYFNKLELVELIENRVVDFIYTLFTNKYVNKICIPLFTYIDVDDKITKISYTRKKDTDETIIIKTNYIKKNIIINDNIINFIKYFKNKNIESNIENTYVELMVSGFSNYILDLIKKDFI